MTALVLAAALALATLWASLALWYRLPFGEAGRLAGATAFIVLGLTAIVAIFGRRRIPALVLFGAALGALLVWWSTIEPAANADFAPEVARQVIGVTDGDILTLTNVRAFDWRSGSEATEHWETRSYDLSKLKTLDLFMSYWGVPQMAHVMMSFGFEGGEHLAWSVEVKRLSDGGFSPVADLFKNDPLVIIASDERDVVRVRSNFRGEDVQLYRLRTPPDKARSLLLEYVADANALAETPEFYNSITTNCTTTVVKMMRAVGDALPFDWRFIVNGYLPEYLYEHGAVDKRVTFDTLVQRAHIDERAKAAGSAPDFSRLIRVGVPSPFDPAP